MNVKICFSLFFRLQGCGHELWDRVKDYGFSYIRFSSRRFSYIRFSYRGPSYIRFFYRGFSYRRFHITFSNFLKLKILQKALQNWKNLVKSNPHCFKQKKKLDTNKICKIFPHLVYLQFPTPIPPLLQHICNLYLFLLKNI